MGGRCVARDGCGTAHADALTERGSQRIFTTEILWRRNFAPVEVTSEAKDNDPIVEALVGVDDALADLLADCLFKRCSADKQFAEHEWQERETRGIDVARSGIYRGSRFARRAGR